MRTDNEDFIRRDYSESEWWPYISLVNKIYLVIQIKQAIFITKNNTTLHKTENN